MVVSSAMRIGTQEVHVPDRHGHAGRARARDRFGGGQGRRRRRRNRLPQAGQEDVDGHGRDGGGQGDAAAGQERRSKSNGAKTNGRAPTNGRKPAAGKRTTNGKAASGDDSARTHRSPSPIRGRARSGQERLDNAWSGLRWRARPSKKRPNRHWTSWGRRRRRRGDRGDEPKTGLFGRVRVEARVRARVRPVGARPAGSGLGAVAAAADRPGWAGRAPGRSAIAGDWREPQRSAAAMTPIGSRTRDNQHATASDEPGTDDRPVPGAAPAVRPAAGAIAARRRPQRWRRRKARATARGGRRPRKLHNGAPKRRRQRTWPRE